MLNLKLLINLCALLLTWSVLNTVYAQAPSSFKAGQKLDCPDGHEGIASAKLCVFSQAAYAMPNDAGECKTGYARIPGMTFCVLDKKSLNLKKRDGLFVVSKSKRKRCKGSFARATGARFCVDKRLALMSKGQTLRLDNMTKVSCAETDLEGTKACKSVCQPGFLKPLGKGMCVEWGLAKNGHPAFERLDQDCSGARYWLKHKPESHGLCIPKHNITSVINRDIDTITRERTHGTTCSGGVAQVVSLAIEVSVQSSANTVDPQTAHGGIRDFKIAPVVVCASPPGPIRLMN